MSNGSSFYQLDPVNNMWDLVDEATYLAQDEGTCIQVREETSGIEIIDDKLRPVSAVTTGNSYQPTCSPSTQNS